MFGAAIILTRCWSMASEPGCSSLQVNCTASVVHKHIDVYQEAPHLCGLLCDCTPMLEAVIVNKIYIMLGVCPHQVAQLHEQCASSQKSGIILVQLSALLQQAARTNGI